ncbi:MAG: VWA domain-containing protein, partial [Verrucomicrobiota bacterium]|nr:VWA domain-containing protein [Verrucomicrobiota bacterium]
MEWVEIYWVYVAFIVTILCGALIIFRQKSGTQQLVKSLSPAHFAQLVDSISFVKRFLKRCLLLTGLFFIFVALARPQYGFVLEEITTTSVDVLFAVDTSKSMLARDMSPSRLERAKIAILEATEHLEGDRVGLIGFSGGAFLQCPLTVDHEAFRQSLLALDEKAIPRGGTDISAAIHEAMRVYSVSTKQSKVLILITDGEENAGNAIMTAREAKSKGIAIFTLGVGTP